MNIYSNIPRKVQHNTFKYLAVKGLSLKYDVDICGEATATMKRGRND